MVKTAFAPLNPPDERYARLAKLYLDQTAQGPKTWGDFFTFVGNTIAGHGNADEAKKLQDDYRTRLAQAAMSARGDDLAKVLIGSGDEDLMKAGIKHRLNPPSQGGAVPVDIKVYQYDMAQRKAAGDPVIPFHKWMQERQGTTNLSKSVIWGQDEHGNVVPLQPGPHGALVRSAMPEGVTIAHGRPIPIDAGTTVHLVDPFSRQIVRSVPKEQYEAERQKALGATEGRKQAEMPEKYSKAVTAMQSLSLKHAILNDEIDRSLALIEKNIPTTGLAAKLNVIPSSDQMTLRERLDTIRSNIGFDELQQMRDASPTGGALGQVTEYENRLLQGLLGSLNQEMTMQELQYNLKRLQNILAERQKIRQEAFQRDYGDQPASVGLSRDIRPPEPPRTPAPQQLPEMLRGRVDPQMALEQARKAIERGAPRDAVMERLRQMGIEPTGL